MKESAGILLSLLLLPALSIPAFAAEPVYRSAIHNALAGSLLPNTGGIGTTIFYVVGGLLMVGAIILLVTKKKMNTK